MMDGEDLNKYCDRALAFGANHAKVIHPGTVVTASWVRMKCRFGCPGYGLNYCCPPDAPTPEETRKTLDEYHRAILFHLEVTRTPDRRKDVRKYLEMLVTLEGDLFKDGYYKSLVFLAGPCGLCKECGKTKGVSCLHGIQARPSMEACGIDVYQTARNNGCFIEPLHDKTETQNTYCLMLVD